MKRLLQIVVRDPVPAGREIIRCLTRAVAAFGLCYGTFGAALIGQSYPGGVAAPFSHHPPGRSAATYPIPPAEELFVFSAYRGAYEAESAVWSIARHDTTLSVLSTHRLAELDRGQYLAFPVLPCATAVVRTYQHQSPEGAFGSQGQAPVQLHVGRSAPFPALPLDPGGVGAEVIAYDRALHPGEQQRIESYLALRYGANLDQTAPRHYLAADGTIVWNALTNRGHAHRVRGLALDRNGGLLVTEANAVGCAPPIIDLTLTDTAGTVYFLVSDDDRPTVLEEDRLMRSWSAQWTGQKHPAVTITLHDYALHTVLDPSNEWQLLVDTTGRASFEHPLRVRGTAGRFSFPRTDRQVHFTFGPVHPQSTPKGKGHFLNVHLMPNPAPEGRFQLRVATRSEAPLEIELYNATGQRVASARRPPALSHLYDGLLTTPGIYLLRLRSGDRSLSRKLTVQ